MNEVKKNRSKNFTDTEKEQFICLEYKNILENKKTDKVNLKEKMQAWENIMRKFNAIQTSGMREVKSLKVLYDNLKMKARKEKNEDKVRQLVFIK